MTEPTAEPVVATVVPEMVITIDGNDIVVPLASMSLSMDSSEREILDAARSLVNNRDGVDITRDGEHSFTVRKALNSSKVYVFPKPVAG